MAIVCWDGSLIVGVDIVDAQHKYLFEIINNMQAKLVRGEYALALSHGLDSMRTYARFHFEAEERLLEQHEYPGLAAHKEAHRQFQDEVQSLARQEPTQQLAERALGYLLVWLVAHIQTEDGRYGPYLAERGVR